MSSSYPAGATDENALPPPTRPSPRRRLRRRRIQPGTLYAGAFMLCVLAAVAAQFFVHMARTEPRDARAIAERELRLNTLAPGEQVFRMVSVFRRPAIDYFRATRGLLVMTNRRLLYLGLQPRDLLATADLPPTFEERDFPIDTLVQVTAGRTLIGLAHAINIDAPNGKLKLGVTSSSWPTAKLMIVGMEARHARAASERSRQAQLQRQAEALERAANVERRKPQFYTVRRGDAIGSIATQWNITPDKLRAWNHLPDNRIRIGQALMVRPRT